MLKALCVINRYPWNYQLLPFNLFRASLVIFTLFKTTVPSFLVLDIQDQRIDWTWLNTFGCRLCLSNQLSRLSNELFSCNKIFKPFIENLYYICCYDHTDIHYIIYLQRRFAECSKAHWIHICWFCDRSGSNPTKVFSILLQFFANFPNFKGKLYLWAKLGDRGTFFIQKFYLRATHTYKPHSRAPACSMWKLSLKIGFLWSKFRWNWGRGFESQTFLAFFESLEIF